MSSKEHLVVRFLSDVKDAIASFTSLGTELDKLEANATGAQSAVGDVGGDAAKLRETELALRSLGVQSEQTAKDRIKKITDAFEKVRDSGTVSSLDIANAWEAASAKIARIQSQVTGAIETANERTARAMQRLGVTSVSSAEEAKKKILQDYEAIRDSGTATPEEVADAWAAAQDKIEAENRKLGTNAQRAASKAEEALTGAMQRVGIQTRASVEESRRQIMADYRAIANSGTASAKELAAAWRATQDRLVAVSRESAAQVNSLYYRTFKNLGGGMVNFGRSWNSNVSAPIMGLAAGVGYGMYQISQDILEIGRSAQIAGVDIERFQKMLFAFREFKVAPDQLASMLKDWQEKLGEARQTGGGELKDFFEKVGPQQGITAHSFDDLDPSESWLLFMKTLDKSKLSREDKIKYLEAAADDATLSLMVYDKLFAQGTEKFDNIYKESEATYSRLVDQGSMKLFSEEDYQVASKLAKSMDSVKDSKDAMMKSLMSQGGVADGLVAINGIIKAVIDFFNNYVDPTVTKILVVIGGFGIAFGSVAIFIGKVNEILPHVIEGAKDMGKLMVWIWNIAKKLGPAFTAIRAAATAAFSFLGPYIAGFFSTLMSGIATAASAIGTVLVSWPFLIAAALVLIAVAIYYWWDDIKAFFGKWMPVIGKFLSDAFWGGIDVAYEFIMGWVRWAQEKLSEFGSFISDVFWRAFEASRAFVAEWISWAAEGLKGLGSDVADAFHSALTSVTDWFTGWWDWAADKISWVTDAISGADDVPVPVAVATPSAVRAPSVENYRPTASGTPVNLNIGGTTYAMTAAPDVAAALTRDQSVKSMLRPTRTPRTIR